MQVCAEKLREWLSGGGHKEVAPTGILEVSIMAHRFMREELYALVWSKPISKLAKEFGTSDVAIAKACRRADIPSPGVGYWTKMLHGKKVRRTPLPPQTPTTPVVVQISHGLSNYLRKLAPEAQEKIARESTEEWRITVLNRLSNLHPALQAWLKENRLHESRLSPHDHSRSHRRYARIERRRLRILSALFDALEKRGHQVAANPQNPDDVALVVDGEKIEFSLTQRQKQLRENLTPEELRYPLNVALGFKSRTTLRPTDTLVFKIHSWIGMGMRTQWRDGARGPLEKRMNAIVAGLLAAAATIRQQRQEREEEQCRLLAERIERERQEEVRRREARRIQVLLQQVTRWLQAADVRAYVDAVRTAIKTARAKIDPERLSKWTSWALTQADQMDPIVAGDLLTDLENQD